VAYALDYHTEWGLPYLRGREGLSRQGRIRLFSNLNRDLRQLGDFFRNDLERRLAPGSEYSWYRLIFPEEDGRLRQFRFVVSDRAAAYSVLRIVYVDEVEPILLPD
jgi:hypothetical protein